MTAETLQLEKGELALVALGSNLGDSERNVKEAILILSAIPKTRVIKVSSLYKTYPVGTSCDKAPYVNCVAALETRLSPFELLAALQEIELDLGRVRTEFWGDRTIDLDILLYEGVVIWSEKLTIPHKRLQWRDFVLSPACEIVPNVKVPTFGWTFRELKTLLDWNFRDFRLFVKSLSELTDYKPLSVAYRKVASEGRKSER